MRKPLLILLVLLTAGLVLACDRPIPEYTVDEAFAAMNDAVEAWLDAESFVLTYEATELRGTVETTESMTVRMTRAGTSGLVGHVTMAIVEPDRWQESVTQFEDGILYVAKNENGTVTRTRSPESRFAFEALYRTFLKTTIAADDVRERQILVDADTCKVSFEFDANRIDDTFYLPAGIDSVTFATVSLTFTHGGTLVALDVSYGTTVDAVSGTESYSVTFAKIDRYVVIARLSASEKATYTEATDDAE